MKNELIKDRWYCFIGSYDQCGWNDFRYLGCQRSRSPNGYLQCRYLVRSFAVSDGVKTHLAVWVHALVHFSADGSPTVQVNGGGYIGSYSSLSALSSPLLW